jgi:polyisoprenyl-phosphate glycosyltransferase
LKKVSVVIPVYYNEQSLPLLYEQLVEVENQLLQKSMQLELIFVDDGSGDCSLEELRKIKQQRADTKVIKLTRNFGAIHASKTGFHFVTGDCFMILAADLQDPPELILEMVQRWLNGAKYVVCARQNREDSAETRLFAYIYYKLLRFFVIKGYPTGGYDLALMDRAMLTHLQNSSKNINTPLFAYWLGFKPEVVYYNRRKRVHGKSRWTFSKKLKFFIDSILGFSIVPIRLISLIGLIISLMSFSYGILVVVNTILGNTDVRGFATIVALISFLFGLVIIMLGIIGEYIWRIFDEINKRPESVIDEIY